MASKILKFPDIEIPLKVKQTASLAKKLLLNATALVQMAAQLTDNPSLVTPAIIKNYLRNIGNSRVLFKNYLKFADIQSKDPHHPEDPNATRSTLERNPQPTLAPIVGQDTKNPANLVVEPKIAAPTKPLGFEIPVRPLRPLDHPKKPHPQQETSLVINGDLQALLEETRASQTSNSKIIEPSPRLEIPIQPWRLLDYPQRPQSQPQTSLVTLNGDLQSLPEKTRAIQTSDAKIIVPSKPSGIEIPAQPMQSLNIPKGVNIPPLNHYEAVSHATSQDDVTKKKLQIRELKATIPAVVEELTQLEQPPENTKRVSPSRTPASDHETRCSKGQLVQPNRQFPQKSWEKTIKMLLETTDDVKGTLERLPKEMLDKLPPEFIARINARTLDEVPVERPVELFVGDYDAQVNTTEGTKQKKLPNQMDMTSTKKKMMHIIPLEESKPCPEELLNNQLPEEMPSKIQPINMLLKPDNNLLSNDRLHQIRDVKNTLFTSQVPPKAMLTETVSDESIFTFVEIADTKHQHNVLSELGHRDGHVTLTGETPMHNLGSHDKEGQQNMQTIDMIPKKTTQIQFWQLDALKNIDHWVQQRENNEQQAQAYRNIDSQHFIVCSDNDSVSKLLCHDEEQQQPTTQPLIKSQQLNFPSEETLQQQHCKKEPNLQEQQGNIPQYVENPQLKIGQPQSKLQQPEHHRDSLPKRVAGYLKASKCIDDICNVMMASDDDLEKVMEAISDPNSGSDSSYEDMYEGEPFKGLQCIICKDERECRTPSHLLTHLMENHKLNRKLIRNDELVFGEICERMNDRLEVVESLSIKEQEMIWEAILNKYSMEKTSQKNGKKDGVICFLCRNQRTFEHPFHLTTHLKDKHQTKGHTNKIFEELCRKLAAELKKAERNLSKEQQRVIWRQFLKI